jgi:sRNA-binding carbon storage regulator CsrA
MLILARHTQQSIEIGSDIYRDCVGRKRHASSFGYQSP